MIHYSINKMLLNEWIQCFILEILLVKIFLYLKYFSVKVFHIWNKFTGLFVLILCQYAFCLAKTSSSPFMN